MGEVHRILEEARNQQLESGRMGKQGDRIAAKLLSRAVWLSWVGCSCWYHQHLTFVIEGWFVFSLSLSKYNINGSCVSLASPSAIR
jgi:hypothetical protein